MNGAPRYTLVIYWSDEDDAYLVSLPDWDGIVMNPSTHGDTYAEAVRNGEEVLEMLIESMKEDGETLPALKPVLTAA